MIIDWVKYWTSICRDECRYGLMNWYCNHCHLDRLKCKHIYLSSFEYINDITFQDQYTRIRKWLCSDDAKNWNSRCGLPVYLRFRKSSQFSFSFFNRGFFMTNICACFNLFLLNYCLHISQGRCTDKDFINLCRLWVSPLATWNPFLFHTVIPFPHFHFCLLRLIFPLVVSR